MTTPRMLHLAPLLLLALFAGCGGGGGGGDDSPAPAPPPAPDSVEIISVTPSSAKAGVNTMFTVEYRYRLTSADRAGLSLGFNITPGNPAAFTLRGPSIDVSGPSGTGSITGWEVPVVHANSEPFLARVYMMKRPEDGIPWAWGSAPIVVAP